MTHTAQQVCNYISELVVSSPNTDRQFSQISAADDYQDSSLVFIDNEKQLAGLVAPFPAVVVTHPKLTSGLEKSGASVIAVKNVRLAQALVKQEYSDYNPRDTEWPEIHPSAVIHKSAQLGKGVHIGANTVIGQNSKIGDNTLIRANCVIEHDVVIGADCVIHNLANIGYECILGNRIIIRPGVIIGNEGFGFAQDEQRRYHRIPHTGTVHIHDDVQIGSNSNIDRGTYGVTTIARGVKIDSLCHIAHNVFVDEDALFVSQSGVAGSCHVGKRVISSGQTGYLDHKTVADDAILVHRCGVTEDIPTAGMWAGTPPKPFKEYVANLNPSQKLKKLEKKIDQKLAQLKELIDSK